MAVVTQVFFGDSNVFLQCKDLRTLPWREVSHADEIVLIVPRVVFGEIDRLKSDGNRPRARRAREISTFLKSVVKSSDGQASLRDADPKVVLKLPVLSDPHRERHPMLDLSVNDDRLVDETLAYRRANPDALIAVLTHDGNLMNTARQCGLAFVEVPDNWLKDPEPDERDRKIAELETLLKLRDATNPRIAISVFDAHAAPLERVQMTVRGFEPLSASEVDQIMHELVDLNPVATVFEGHGKPLPRPDIMTYSVGVGRYRAPTEADIQRYKEEAYPAWLERSREFLERLHQELGSPSRRLSIEFNIENVGGSPAESVLLEFKALGGLVLCPPPSGDEDYDGAERPVRFPVPPDPPKATWMRTAFDLVDPLGAVRILPPLGGRGLADALRPTDPHAWYWKEGNPNTIGETWVRTCADFRHQIEGQRFRLDLFVPFEPEIVKGAVSCRLTARNLPERVERTIPISITYVGANTVAAAKKMLPNSGLRHLLRRDAPPATSSDVT